MRHIERHRTQRIGWLRAAVLGANDGIVSTASLVLGVAAVPLCLVTVATGLHLTFFRHEYNALLRKTVHLIPYARYVTPAQRDPKYFLPFGLAYTLFGIITAIMVIIY